MSRNLVVDRAGSRLSATRHRARRASAGLTLVEVIVALVVFGIGATVLAAAYVNVLNAIDNVKVDQQFEQEIALVRSHILLEPERDVVEEGGDLPTGTMGDAVWSATITPSESIADLFRVDIEIRLGGTVEHPEERVREQTLWVLRPEWSEPSERDELRSHTRKRLEEMRRGRSL